MSTGELLCRVAAAIRRHHVDVGVAQQLVDHLAVGNGDGNGNGDGDKESLNKEVYPKLLRMQCIQWREGGGLCQEAEPQGGKAEGGEVENGGQIFLFLNS